MPTAVVLMDLLQEGLAIGPASPLPGQEQPVAGPDVDRPEQDPLGIAPADDHRGRLASYRPTSVQGRKQPQVGFIFRQQHTPRRQVLHPSADGAFFSRARGPAATRGGSASTRSPAAAVGGGWYPRTRACRR